MSRRKIFDTTSNFRLTLSDEDTKDHLWSKKFSRMAGLVTVITVVVVTFVLFYALYALTPLKTLIPGYPDAQTKRDEIENAIRIDSLESIITRWELYSENLRRVVDGQEPLKVDSLLAAEGKNAVMATMKPEEMAKKDSLLKDMIAQIDNSDSKADGGKSQTIEGMHFFTPVSGVISQGYDKAFHPYVDITAQSKAVVKSVLDGTVISAGWNDDEGYAICIQHEGDLISMYKHNGQLMKKTGDKVTAGTPIAMAGGAGSDSEGAEVSFELWHKGETVDPTKYISF